MRMVPSLLLMALVLVVGFKVGATLDLQRAIREAPDAQTLVKYRDTDVPRWQFELYTVARDQLSAVDYWLLTRRPSSLWAFVYTMGGLGGGVVAVWLTLAGIKLDTQRVGTLSHLASAAAAGAVLYLLLRLPAPLLVSLFRPDLSGAANDPFGFSLLNSSIALAVLAGLFTSVFFERTKAWFKNLFKRNDK